jgi:hypothetical protein
VLVDGVEDDVVGLAVLGEVFFVAESVVAVGVGASQNDSAAAIATALYDHRERLVVIACLFVVYAALLVTYLGRLSDLLRRDTDRPRSLGSLVLAGGALFVALHAVSDLAPGQGEATDHVAS